MAIVLVKIGKMLVMDNEKYSARRVPSSVGSQGSDEIQTHHRHYYYCYPSFAGAKHNDSIVCRTQRG
jgi:hypothetical protein